jgi:hypothetical protein
MMKVTFFAISIESLSPMNGIDSRTFTVGDFGLPNALVVD